MTHLSIVGNIVKSSVTSNVNTVQEQLIVHRVVMNATDVEL